MLPLSIIVSSLILVGIIAAKSKPFVVHLNVLNYNNCPSIGRYLFLNPVRYIYVYIYIYIYIYVYIYIYIYISRIEWLMPLKQCSIHF